MSQQSFYQSVFSYLSKKRGKSSRVFRTQPQTVHDDHSATRSQNIVFDTADQEIRNGELDKARSLLGELAAKGNVEACFRLGNLALLKERNKENLSCAARWFKRAADHGHAIGEYELAVMYRHGEGVDQNESEAFRLFLSAAEKGIAMAQYNLGALYGKGVGTPPDMEQAVKWTLAAAKQEFPDALYRVAQYHLFGMLVQADRQEALLLLSRAAELGHARSQFALGVNEYLIGKRSEAAALIARACVDGHPASMGILREIADSEISIGDNEVVECAMLKFAVDLGIDRDKEFTGFNRLFSEFDENQQKRVLLLTQIDV